GIAIFKKSATFISPGEEMTPTCSSGELYLRVLKDQSLRPCESWSSSGRNVKWSTRPWRRCCSS
ncbi:unnamed protein product, partial [Heterosigma akashiwo]